MKPLFRISVILVLAGISIFLFIGIEPVQAQCGVPQPSSCITCHEQEDPVSQNGEWHIIHAQKDICIDCHGGNASTMDKHLAHEDLVAQPLSDIYTDCHGCHTDYTDRAQVFAVPLGVTPGSCATPTAILVSNPPGGSTNGGNLFSANLPPSTTSSQPLISFLFMASALAIFCLGLVWLERHHVDK